MNPIFRLFLFLLMLIAGSTVLYEFLKFLNLMRRRWR